MIVCNMMESPLEKQDTELSYFPRAFTAFQASCLIQINIIVKAKYDHLLFYSSSHMSLSHDCQVTHSACGFMEAGRTIALINVTFTINPCEASLTVAGVPACPVISTGTSISTRRLPLAWQQVCV